MKTFNEANDQSLKAWFIDIRNASKDGAIAILKAMTAEMDEAIAEKRLATIEGVYHRLAPSSAFLQ